MGHGGNAVPDLEERMDGAVRGDRHRAARWSKLCASDAFAVYPTKNGRSKWSDLGFATFKR